ncbi:MAG: hypothetical protein ACRDQH_04665 [Pseudonocardiaceae bacterium]
MTAPASPLAEADAAMTRHRRPLPGVVVAVDEIDAIAARVAHSGLSWWQRLTRPNPPGWRAHTPREQW